MTTIHLKLTRNDNGVPYYSGMHLPKEMDISGLLEIIGAKNLEESIHSNGHTEHNGPCVDSGELKDRTTYKIHTDDVDNTLRLIREYKNENKDIVHTDDNNRTLDLMNNYKDED